jgi:hypothetical protein
MIHYTNTGSPIDFPCTCPCPQECGAVCQAKLAVDNQSLVYRLYKRAQIRRQIPGRKSVEEGTRDRIADLLEEAAVEIERLKND